MIRVMSKKRTWAILFVLANAAIIWTLLRSISIWYSSTLSTSSPSNGPWPAVYASIMVGAVFGLMSMVAAAAVAVPAMLVTWITVLVLLAVCGCRSRDVVVVEGTELTAEIFRSVLRMLIKEGNLVAAAFALIAYFFYLLRTSAGNGECGVL